MSRRISTPPPSSGTGSRTTGLLAGVVVVIAAALLALAATRTSGSDVEPSATDGVAGTAPISTVGRSCATFGTESDTPPLEVGSTTLRSDDSSGEGANTATKSPGGKKIGALTVGGPGEWAQSSVPGADTSAVVIDASGGLAPMSTAFGATRAPGASGSGLAVQTCPSAHAQSWFVGAGSTAEHSGTLVLTNPGNVDAVVDVAMYGADGQVSVVGGSGVPVKPGQTKRLPLDDLGTGEDELALSVSTSRGTISASVLDATGKLAAHRGSDYLPAAADPSTDSVVAGVPAGADGGELIIANPSDRAANVSITVLGKDGESTPSGLESASVGAGSVKKVALPGNVVNGSMSVRLKSEVPVTGAVRAFSAADLAYATSAEPVTGTVAVPVGFGGTTVDVSAASAAVKGSSTLQLRAYDSKGKESGKGSVDLEAGQTRAFDPLQVTGARENDTAYVTLTAEGKGVRAAATFSDGDDWSTVPLADLPATVVRPAVEVGSLR
ncbi:DUF5719 family protein [Nocardioidaceae bacterium SCSIO 66511]|nr:DUF5719 family protein [Nocardioidaceae bacterium SCSIO 66511]